MTFAEACNEVALQNAAPAMKSAALVGMALALAMDHGLSGKHIRGAEGRSSVVPPPNIEGKTIVCFVCRYGGGTLVNDGGDKTRKRHRKCVPNAQ
jgi:hypothetical protein